MRTLGPGGRSGVSTRTAGAGRTSRSSMRLRAQDCCGEKLRSQRNHNSSRSSARQFDECRIGSRLEAEEGERGGDHVEVARRSERSMPKQPWISLGIGPCLNTFRARTRIPVASPRRRGFLEASSAGTSDGGADSGSRAIRRISPRTDFAPPWPACCIGARPALPQRSATLRCF